MASPLEAVTEARPGRAPRRPRLALFLLLSVGAHAALLLGHRVVNARIEAGTLSEVIAVRLDGEETDAAAQSPPRVTPREAGRGAQARALALTAAIPRATTLRTDQPQSPATGAGETASAAPTTAEAAARVRAQVLSDLARHFYYPALARSRGWQGRVLLAFRVERDGLLHDPRVLHTSGFGILDEAALNSLRQVERIPGADSAPLDLQIPVVYRLTDAR